MRLPGLLALVVPISLASVALWLTAAVAQAQELPGVPSAAKAAVTPVQNASKPVVNTAAPVARPATTTATTAVRHIAAVAAPPPSSAKPTEQQKSAPPAKRTPAPEPGTRAATEAVAPVTQTVQPAVSQAVAAAAPEVEQVKETVEPVVASVEARVPSVAPEVRAVEPIVEVAPLVVDTLPPLPLLSAPAAATADTPALDETSVDSAVDAASADAPDDDVSTIAADEPANASLVAVDSQAPGSAVSTTVINEAQGNPDMALAPAQLEPTRESLAVVPVVDDAQALRSELDLIPAAPFALADIALATKTTSVLSLDVIQIDLPSLAIAPPLPPMVALAAASDIRVVGPIAHEDTPTRPTAPPMSSAPPSSPAPASALASSGGSPGTAVPIVIALSLAAAWRALWLVARLLPVGITLLSLAPPG